MDMVTTLIINYALVLLINFLLALFCLIIYKDSLYRQSVYLWVGTFTCLVLQGIFQKDQMMMILAFSSYFFVFRIQLKILNQVTELVYPVTKYALVVIACLLVSAGAYITRQGFFWVSLPAALGLASVMLHSAYQSVRSHLTGENRGGALIFSALIASHALHLLDYPFLRNNPEYGALGFSIALILLIAFSIFLPSFILRSLTSRYVEDLKAVNDQLLDYQKQMGELMSLAQIGELSYGFVHDMASPTTLLMHYSSEITSLQSGGVQNSEKLLPFSKGIERATNRLVKLQQMFKSMIKNEDRNSEPGIVNVSAVVQNCCDLYGPFLIKHKIKIKNVEEISDSMIISIPGVIDRVLLNLMQNAINILVESKTKKITLTIRGAPSNGVMLIVQDTGPGLPPERLANLWERFGHSGTGQKMKKGQGGIRSGGSGFGLYKVKQMVESIQGKIDVQSSSKGALFIIELPRKINLKAMGKQQTKP